MREGVGEGDCRPAGGELGARHHDGPQAGELEPFQALEPALVHDEHLGLGAGEDVAQELALEVDVHGDVDGAGPDDAEPRGEVVERRREHRRDPVSRADPERCERSRDPLGPVAQLRVAQLGVQS